MTLYEDLKWRGLIKDISSPDLEEKLNNGKMTFYIGTDPTADSMHIGHFSSFLISKRLSDAGHNPILLIGGGTGLIGDPKPTAERAMIGLEEVSKNIKGLTKQAEDIFGFSVVNNYDWLSKINFITFLRDYGKHFNINYMLDKDIVRRRLDTGITYTEFSYMIMQAMDFLHLNENENVTLQVAGSDQWGNITAGIDLIRKKTGKEVYGFTMSLVTTKDGTKFGKSEGNALWLDKNKTSSYELYQFFLNVEDEMVIDYLKIFTFLSKEEIETLANDHYLNPQLRQAHKALAKEVITFLHGDDEYQKAVSISEALFSEKITDLNLEDIKNIFKYVPNITIEEKELTLIDLLVNYNICSSKREAREFMEANAISINNIKVNDENKIIDAKLAIDSQALVIKKGKKKYYLALFK